MMIVITRIAGTSLRTHDVFPAVAGDKRQPEIRSQAMLGPECSCVFIVLGLHRLLSFPKLAPVFEQPT